MRRAGRGARELFPKPIFAVGIIPFWCYVYFIYLAKFCIALLSHVASMLFSGHPKGKSMQNESIKPAVWTLLGSLRPSRDQKWQPYMFFRNQNGFQKYAIYISAGRCVAGFCKVYRKRRKLPFLTNAYS